MKFLVSPLLLLFVLCAVLLLACRWKLRRHFRVIGKLFWWAAVLLLAALYGLATPSGAAFLEAAVSIPDSPGDTEPRVIVVLAGGYFRGADPELDVLSAATASRTTIGVRWAEEHPEALLVMAGDGTVDGRSESAMGELMKDFAVALGIDADRIVLESDSTNTREHPERLLEMEDIDSGTELGIVTSAWHLRRARREFERYFDSVAWRGARLEPRASALPFPERVLPDAQAFAHSTDYLREIVGAGWYEVRANAPQ